MYGLTDRVLNTLLKTDAYKLDHRRAYPPGTQVVFSNMTARGSRIEGVDHTVFFGLQAWLTIFQAEWDEFFSLTDDEVTEVLDGYERVVTQLLGVDSFDTSHFRELHSLGFMPLYIRAFHEGSLVPVKVPYLTIENTHPRFAWLTNYFETELSAALWQPITSATLSWHTRRMLNWRAEESGADLDDVAFQGHDFSYRGMAGTEAAAASGAGHLLSFVGTDTLPTIRFVETFYPDMNPNTGSPTDTYTPTERLAASVVATEHSVMMADGEDGEFGTYDRLIGQYPTGTLALVSDTWNLWRVLHEYLPVLKDKIMARDGRLVIRPDSGDPIKILLGDSDAEAGTPERQGVVDALWDHFGGTVNEKGLRVLDPHIGAVYGDGITYVRADDITRGLIAKGYVSTTVTLGFGSFTFQYQTRDTFNMAMKATWVKVNGEGRDIVKNPITDNGTKKSAKGRLAVRRWANGMPYLIESPTEDQELKQELSPVFDNGEIVRYMDFKNVRSNLVRDTELYDRYRNGHVPPGRVVEIARKVLT